MGYQDFLQNYKQKRQQEPIELPDYDPLPTQVDQIFGKPRPTDKTVQAETNTSAPLEKPKKKGDVLDTKLGENAPFETLRDVKDWTPDKPIQDLKQLGSALKVRRQLYQPQPQKKRTVAAKSAPKAIPYTPQTGKNNDQSEFLNQMDFRGPTDADRMMSNVREGMGLQPSVPESRRKGFLDKYLQEEAQRSYQKSQGVLEDIEANTQTAKAEQRLSQPQSTIQTAKGADSSKSSLSAVTGQKERETKARLRTKRVDEIRNLSGGSLNPVNRMVGRGLGLVSGYAPDEIAEALPPIGRIENAGSHFAGAAIRGASSIPEGVARFLEQNLVNRDAVQTYELMNQFADAEDKRAASEGRASKGDEYRKIAQGSLESQMHVGDYLEPLTKAGEKFSQAVLPTDPTVEGSINPLKRGFWESILPEAAGSMAPFFAGGAAGAAVKIPRMLSAGVLGAGMEIPQGYHEARDAGATPEQLSKTTDIRTAAGMLEMFGAESLLGKIGMKGKSIPGYLAKEALQEGVQEAGQSLTEDVGDKYYAGTKPNLAWSQIGHNALENAVPALFLGVGGGAMGVPAHLAERKANSAQVAEQIESLANAEPSHPVVQAIASLGIDPGTITQADDRAVDELSTRLQSMAKMDSQIQQMQGQREVLAQQAQNAYDAQLMGRVPSSVDMQAAQQLPMVDQAVAELTQQKEAVTQDLAQNVSPLFKNLAKAVGNKQVEPLADAADDQQGDLLKEVRKAGGIAAPEGAVEAGELERLSPKEIGSTGLISRKGGESPDQMRERMVSEGLSNAETPHQLIEEVESAAIRKKNQKESESFEDYHRGQMSAEEQAQSDKLDKVLADKAHPFTQVYRQLDNPKGIYTSKLAKQFVEEADKLGFSDDFIERSLVEFQQQRGIASNGTNRVVDEPGRSMAKPSKPAEPGVSMSPYKVLEANNKELLSKLHKTNLNSKEGIAGVNQLREWARANDIEQRHVNAWISDIQNWQKKYGVPKNPDAQSSATRKPLGTEVKATQPTRTEAAPASSPSGFSQEQRKLLGTDHTNLLDSEFDEYMGQVESLQNMSVRGKEFGGFDINEAERKGLVSKLIEIRKERKARVKAKRLPALTASHTKATAPKAELGEQLVEQAAERETTDVPRETANVPQVKAIDQAAHEAATSPKNDLPEPTQAQKEAGNYQKGHISIHGLDVTIENPKGSKRSGTDRGGKKWEVTMSAHYGYIRRTIGADEEQIDVYVGDNPESGKVFVVDQIDAKTGKFDEHKVILGVESRSKAEKLYDAHFSDDKGPERRKAVTEMTVDGFKEWLKTEDNTKPVANLEAKEEKPSELRPLPAKNSTKRIEGTLHSSVAAERVGGLDFELWENESTGNYLMQTVYGTGEVVEGSSVEDRNERSAKKRFKDKVEIARQSLGERADEQVAAVEPTGRGETVGKAAVAESGEAEGKRDASTAFPDTRSGRIAQQLADGKSLTNIQAVRKQFDTKIGTEAAKKLEEDIELAGVLAARQIVDKGLSTKETYAALLDLHNRMPNLNTRTSESVRDQAYSTPLPIAYAASRLAGITKKTTVYEPTGGNGALVMEASPDNTTINDLNPQRVENLRAQGFEANKADATKVSLGAKVDVVIANPPFGVVKENGQSKQFETPFGKTVEIDHAIVFKALEAMADDGKAVLIVGGVNRMATTRQARSDAYNQSAKRKFYPNLYDTYNVVDHFTIDGSMYAKQGAAWPVDVIVIDGKGKSARQYPAVDVPVIVRSYEELGDKISESKVLDSTERQQSVGSGEGATARPGRLPGFDDSEASGSTEKGRRSGRSDVIRAPKSGISESPGTKQNQPVVRGTGDKSSAQQSAPERTGAEGKTAKAGSSVSETTIRENKPASVGERTDSQTGRASKLESIFDDWVDEQSGVPKETQPETKSTKPSIKENNAKIAALFGKKPVKPGPPASRTSPVFDQAMYEQVKPLLEERLALSEGMDDETAMRALLDSLKEEYGDDALPIIIGLKPYILRFMGDRATPAETETKPEAKVEPRQKQVISEKSESSHAAYEPLSTARSLNVAIPKNMSGAVKTALANFEQRHGSSDAYVADKLGYKPEEVEKYFSAEQVDALALAVDNIEQGKGFVIGDQTGIGKGRINAGIIRYAIKNGKTPVFVTQKPALYADMIRDLKDIGMENIRPLITNSGEAIPLNDSATEWMHAAVDAKAKGEKVPKLPSDAKIFRAKADHVTTLEQVGMSGNLKGYDAIFTTYDQMNPMGGLFDKERHTAVSSAVRGGVLIMDESHTAGGVAPAGRGGKPTPSRSKFFRELVKAAGSVFYSSATYAKRPDVMDLYSKTDLGLLGKNGDALTELFSKGGVALQQVVASKLAEAGQYLRRERTFDGITYSPEVVEVNKQHAENVSTTMRLIVAFDNAKRQAVADLKENVKASAAIASEDGSIGNAGVDSSNFTSLMHNVIDQMLLGLKADQAAAQAIKAIQNGERPVLTVSNTMESFLKDAGLSPGDAVDLSFKDVLMRYLQRSRDIVIKDRNGNKTRRPLDDDELGGKGLAAFEAVQDFINESDFGDIPISPIDRVRELIEKAGYKVDEITGRGTRVDSTGAVPILRARSAQDTKVAGRRRVIGDFNNGRIDALILNQAGSTGISLHASPAGGKDVKPRHMIIWQAEKNIDTHMQMLGRVNRTGQVTLPRYTQMIADVPAEKRPAAVLLKKMASLSANTTASRKSAVQTEGVTDFINELGDTVVARILANDSELSNKLGDPLDYDGDELSNEGAARKVSGRIPLLTLAEQHEVYERIESEYADYLAQKEAMGENPLEARTEDFRAETISKEVLTEGVPGSPFSEPAHLEKVKINRTVKPYTSAEVSKTVRENLGLAGDASESQVKDVAHQKVSGFIKENGRDYEAYKNSLFDGISTSPDDAKAFASAQGQVQKAITTANHWSTVARVAVPGAMVTVNTDAGSVSGVVLDVMQRGKPKNPYALGSWVTRLAVLDGRELRLSFNEMINKDGVLKVGQSPEVNRLNPETGMFESRPMLPEFDASQGTKKQTRYMVTGNIVSGYAALPKGQILNYTDSEGNVKQGVLLPANFDAAKTMAEMPVELSTASQVIDFFDKVPRGNVSDAKQEFTIIPEKYGTDLEIRVLSAKSIGGKYYLDKALTDITGNFVKQGGLMKVNIDRAKLPAVMSWLKEQGIGLNASHKAEAKEMLGQSRTAPPASRRTRESVESSPEFTKWFGKSQVVDQSGKPMPLYHGTQARNEIEAVDPSRFLTGSHFGPGFYMAESPEIASQGYAEGHLHPRGQESAGTPSVYKLYARIENPLDVNKPAEPKMIAAAFGSPNVDLEEMGFGSRPTNEVMYKQLAKRMDDDKGAVNQKLQEMGYDGITRLNRASDESPEHREWVVFDPRQVKSATGNRGTFDESANLSTSRRQVSGPASELANPMDVLLHAETITKSRGSRGVRMYVNDHARALLGASLTEVFGEDYSNVNAINLSREEISKVADYLEGEAKGLTGDYQAGATQFVQELRDMLVQGGSKQKTFNIVDITPFEQRYSTGFRPDAERAVETFKGDVREESFHWSQREVGGTAIASVGSSWAQSSKGYGKYRKALLKLGYPDDPEVIAAETAAKIAAGKFDDLGIRTEADHQQADEWLASYFERIADKHGVEALTKFDRLLPKATEAKQKGELSAKERLRQAIKEEAATATGQRANRPGSPGGSGQTVRAGNQEKREEGGKGPIPRRSPEEPFNSASSEDLNQASLFDEKGMPKKEWGDIWKTLADILNIPKALRASGDLSAGGRQGWFMSIPPSRWHIAAKSFGKSLQASEAFGLKKGADKRLHAEMKQRPAYRDAVAAGLAVHSNDPLSVQTELFGSRLAGKIPWAKYSEQAYKTHLDWLSLMTFEVYKKSIDKQIKDPKERFEAYQAAADWINTSSGRGSYRGKFGAWYQKKAAPLLNVIGWAPGLVYSRFQLLNPYTYAQNLKNPGHRVVFRKQMSEVFQSAAVLYLTAVLAKAGGALVSTDPDEADFLKLRFGTTRYDVLAGLQQVARLSLRIGDYLRIKATTDTSTEEGQKKVRKASGEASQLLGRFGRTKLGPVPGFVVDWWNDWVKVTGERHAPGDFITSFKEGNKVKGVADLAEDPIISQALPLFWADMVAAYEQGWRANGNQGGLEHLAKVLPAGLGIGVQDYDRPEWKKETRKQLDRFDLDPQFPKHKTGEKEEAYQKRVKEHIADQEAAINRFSSSESVKNQPLTRQKELLKQEMSEDGRNRLEKLRPDDIEDDRAVRAWILLGRERLKNDENYKSADEETQKKILQSYYSRMNPYKAQPANKVHGYQRPDFVDEDVLKRKIREAIKAQQ